MARQDLDRTEKERAVEVLKAGLECTLSQARHLCGTSEKDPFDGHSFVKRRDCTVRFVVQWLDTLEDRDTYPSFDDIAQHNFCSSVLGNHDDWTVSPMTPNIKPEARPDSKPAAAALKANFIRGGLVFIMHQHHYANDVTGWAGPTHQLAENYYAIVNQTHSPPWDPACLDLSRFSNPASLVFALRSSTNESTPLSWAEAVDMRRRMHSPEVHPRIQHNVAAFSITAIAPTPPLKLTEITNSATQDSLDALLTPVSPIREKKKKNLHASMSSHPLSILQTHHSSAGITSADFGFARPVAYYFLMDRFAQEIVVIYPPRGTNLGSNEDERPEFSISYEAALKEALIADEYGRWMLLIGVVIGSKASID
ncbi:hypothetical protein BDV06DRAFT_215445 [Aspergillus oleicola]